MGFTIFAVDFSMIDGNPKIKGRERFCLTTWIEVLR